MKARVLTILFLLAANVTALPQCAMCKAQLENNISNGNIGIAAGINFGILYLFVAPYLAVGTLAFFWFRSSKQNAVKLTKSDMAV
ncbi:MAG: hypothetical protein ACKO96_44620 [Flammeovirgaceae bacterium]